MKDLTTLLTISDTVPTDFYKNPVYLESVKLAVETASSLVHSIDDEGRSKAKADAAAIRKYVKTTNGFTKTVFDSLTGKVKEWREQFTSETKKLEAAADGIIKQFDELEKKRLYEISALVNVEIKNRRIDACVDEIFMTSPDLKITISGWVTPAGNLTAKAIGEISAVVGAEIAAQRQYRDRQNILKIRCLENEINPPLSEDYFGRTFFEDDQSFEEKLNHLISVELQRRSALIAKQESDKLAALEKAEREKQAALELAERQKQQAVEDALKSKESEQQERFNKENLELKQHTHVVLSQTKPGTKRIRYTITFEATVKDTITNEDFKAMIKKDVQCSGRALKAITKEEVTEC